MAITLQELLVKVSADISEYDKGMKDALKSSAGVEEAMNRAGASMGSVVTQLNALGSSLTRVGTMLTAAITLPLAGVSIAALKVAGDLEQAKVAFTTMLGSAAEAQKHLEALRDFSLKTPFEFGDLVQASKRLQALGFAAKDVIPTLTAIGDAAAGLGLGAQGIERISLALGQMQAKGRVSAQEMNQLAEAGINGWKLLAEAISKAEGKTVSIGETMKMAEKGMIDGAAAVQVLLTGMEDQFGGLMDKQSKTLLGMWSNLKDNLSKTLAEIGDALAPVAKSLIQSITDILPAITNLVQGFAKLPVPVQEAVFAFAAFAAAAGPLLAMVGQVDSGVTSLIKIFANFSSLAGTGLFGGLAAEAGTATTAVAGLSGALGAVALSLGVIASLGVGAFIAFSQLDRDTAKMRELNDQFDDFLVSKTKAFMGPLPEGVGPFDSGLRIIQKAFDEGAISLEHYNKLMTMLKANMEDFKIPPATKDAMEAASAGLGITVSVVGGKKALKDAGAGDAEGSDASGLIRPKSPEELAKEAEKAAHETKQAFAALGLKDLQQQLDEAVKAFHKLSAAGQLTGKELFLAATRITHLRQELAKLSEERHVDLNFMDPLTGQVERAETAVEELHRKITTALTAMVHDLPMAVSEAFKMDGLVTGNTNLEAFNNLLLSTSLGFVANENKAGAFFAELNRGLGLSQQQWQGFIDQFNKLDALKFFGLQTPAALRENTQLATAFFDVLLRTGEPAERLWEIIGKTRDAQLALTLAAEAYNKHKINGYQLETVQLAALEEAVRKEQEKGHAITLQQSREIFELQQKLAKAYVDIWKDVHREVSGVVDKLDTGLAHALLNIKNFGAEMKKTLASVFEDVFTDVFKAITKPLTDWLKTTITNAVSPIVSSIASKLGLTVASGAATVAGGAVKAGTTAATTIVDETGAVVDIGGGAAKTASSAAGTGSSAASSAGSLAGTINVISGAVSAISSVIGNFQQAGMNKSLDLIVNHTLRTFNEIFEQRKDHWEQYNHTYDRLGEIWNAITAGCGNIFDRLGEILTAIREGGVGGGGGGATERAASTANRNGGAGTRPTGTEKGSTTTRSGASGDALPTEDAPTAQVVTSEQQLTQSLDTTGVQVDTLNQTLVDTNTQTQELVDAVGSNTVAVEQSADATFKNLVTLADISEAQQQTAEDLSHALSPKIWLSELGSTLEDVYRAQLKAAAANSGPSPHLYISDTENVVNRQYQPLPEVNSSWQPIQIVIKDNVFRDRSDIDYLTDLVRKSL